MKKITLLFALCLLSWQGFSQTFTDTGGPYDMQNGNGGTGATCGTADELNLPLTVSGVGILGTTNYIESVTVNITHTWNSDVRLSLIDPSGTVTLELINAGVGGSGDGFTNCMFVDGGATLPTANTTPVTGSFAPHGAGGFAAFNTPASIDADGDWTLFVCDNVGGDTGEIVDWSITFVQPTTDELDWYNLQHPGSGTITDGDGYDVYAQGYEPGVTDAAGQGAGVEAWIGYSDTDSDPSGAGWTWIVANYNTDVGNNDEYTVDLDVTLGPGTYYYASRWSLNSGPYTYGGYNAGGGGTWDGTTNVNGMLTINPGPGADCTNPIVVSALPYNHADDTVNHGDDYSSVDDPCSSSSYLNGDDVVYSFTPASDMAVNIATSNTGTWVGLFVYEECPFVTCTASDTNSSGNPVIDQVSLTAGTTYYIVISTFPNPQSTAYTLDITEITCPDPSGMTADTVTTTTADLSWTENDSATMWNLEWKAGADFTPGNMEEDGSDTASGSPAYNATGLTSNTTYYFYYQTDCGADVSVWVGPFTFTTLCDTFLAPFTEDFENMGTIPDCWSMDDGAEDWNFSDSGSGNHIGDNGTISGSTSSGGYFAWVDSSGADADAILLSPMVDVSGLSTPALSFYELSDNEGNANSQLDVEVWDGAAWNNVGTYNTNTAGWELKTIDLSGLTITGDVQARFTFTEPTSGDFYDDIAIDDVSFDELPSCVQPSGVAASPDSLTEATVTWTAGGSETDWSYEYGVTGFTQGSGTTGTVSTTPTLSLSALTAGETYDIYVQANCSGGDSDFVSVTWTQPNEGNTCDAPIVIASLPYNTTDDTANYGDDYSSADEACSSSSYLNGDDVVYSYTPASDMSVNVTTSGTGTWVGMFIYSDCPFTTCVASDTQSGGNPSISEVSLTAGTTYYIVISTYPSPQSTAYTLDITENTCTNATVTYTVVNDCDNSGGFLIDVEVTDMGTATSLTVSDDQGSATQAVTMASTVQFGPYVNATDVVITVTDDNDSSCTQSSTNLTQVACPPTNDDCANAIDASVLPYTNSQDASGATNNAGFITTCSNTMNDGVWYMFTPSVSGTLTIDVTNVTGWDPQLDLYSGSCGALVCEASADSSGTGGSESLADMSVVAGTTYYINVGYWSGSTDSAEGPFQIDISDITLGLGDVEQNMFTYFPNPVNDRLSLRAQQNIQNVSVFNMLGQEVIRVAPNVVDADLDMTALQAGTYFVQVTINDTTETIKVIRK